MQVRVGGVDGGSCQHFQVMMTQLLQKHWELQDDRRKDVRHGREEGPTMLIASVDTKTAFDVGKTEAYCKHSGRA